MINEERYCDHARKSERGQGVGLGVFCRELCHGVLIGFSIIQLRRHLFIDLISGVLTAIVIGALCQLILQAAVARSDCKSSRKWDMGK
ncbi:hypothetical protein [Xenorhabdus miraniensis]|uniref:hypothetical protein n=1 Tax=Xenorhabdus miraniensis TaxID=351674 RepID=UPI000C053543|nr:hypothetical protein [Xenorhabdus miraniensis]